MKQWELVFKALANVNRLKIIKMLSSGKELNVGEIAGKLKISYKSTSQHLIILKNLGVSEDEGRDSRVYYCLNNKMQSEFQKAIKLFT